MLLNGYGEKLLLGRNGRMIRGRDARSESGDDMPIPHIISYASIISGAYHTYYHGSQDEAMRHARADALVMQRDAFLMGLMEERMRHVSTLNWHLEIPDEDNPDQVLVRDHIKTTLSNMTGKDRSLRRIIKWGLWKMWYGRMGAQIRWKWENQAGLKTLTVGKAMPVNGDKIIYRWSHTPAIEVNAVEDLPGAEYIPATNEGARALLLKGSWRNKFAIFTHDQEDSDFFDIDRADAIHGVGIRSKGFWLNWIRLEWESRVASFFDSLGTGGFLVFFFEMGNSTSEENVTEAATKYSGFTKLIIPRSIGDGGAGVEFLPINMTGVDALGTLRDVIRKDIERYIVGQEGSGEATEGGGIGNNASTEFRMATKWKIAKDDSELLAEELTGDPENPSLVYMIQAYTFPESVAWKPNGFSVRFKFDLQEEQSAGKIEAATAITSMGVTLRADEVRSAGGFGKPGEGDETVGGKETLGLDKPGFGDDKKPGGEGADKKVDDGGIEQHIAQEATQYAKDASGHEHKGKGEGGGQFTGKKKDDELPPIPRDKNGRPELSHADRIEEYYRDDEGKVKTSVSDPKNRNESLRIHRKPIEDGEYSLIRVERRPGIHLVKTADVKNAASAHKQRQQKLKASEEEEERQRHHEKSEARQRLKKRGAMAKNLIAVVKSRGEFEESDLIRFLGDDAPVGAGLTSDEANGLLYDMGRAGYLDRKFKGKRVVWVPDEAVDDGTSEQHLAAAPTKYEDGHWVTFEGGTHVFVDNDGKIIKGPSHMVGRKPDELGHKVTKEHGQTEPVESEHRKAAKQWVAASAGLSPEKQEEYTGHMEHALSKLPAGISKEANSSLKAGGVKFHADLAALRAEAKKLSGKADANVVGFAKDRGMATDLHLDGGEDPRGTYIHELWHAADNQSVYSDDKGWQAAYKKDILKGKHLLSRYALTNASEGFAEFGRYLSVHGEAATTAKFPTCVKHLKSKGLL